MSTLRQAVQDYIEMRRGLGFKLREIERALIDFAAFLEANDTPNITTELALAWAQRPSRAQPSITRSIRGSANGAPRSARTSHRRRGVLSLSQI